MISAGEKGLMATIRGLVRVTFAWCIALFFFPSSAPAAVGEDEFDEKPWAEIEVQLPAFPEQENLIPFRVGSVSDKRFMIDEKSVSVGSDGVIRYVLVVISDAGGRTISYEGMRCATRERRLYAFGRDDKTWSKARSEKWMKIRGNTNQYPVALYSDYFCAPEASVIFRASDAVRRLKYSR